MRETEEEHELWYSDAPFKNPFKVLVEKVFADVDWIHDIYLGPETAVTIPDGRWNYCGEGNGRA